MKTGNGKADYASHPDWVESQVESTSVSMLKCVMSLSLVQRFKFARIVPSRLSVCAHKAHAMAIDALVRKALLSLFAVQESETPVSYHRNLGPVMIVPVPAIYPVMQGLLAQSVCNGCTLPIRIFPPYPNGKGSWILRWVQLLQAGQVLGKSPYGSRPRFWRQHRLTRCVLKVSGIRLGWVQGKYHKAINNVHKCIFLVGG